MPRTTRPSRTSRSSRPALLRISATIGTSLLLLVLTALPAFAASGTKPDPAAEPYIVGSLEQLGTAAIVGIVLGVIAYMMLEPATADDDDGHH